MTALPTRGLLAVALVAAIGLAGAAPPPSAPRGASVLAVSANAAVGNFSQAIGRLVALLGIAGGGILAIAWARVALSWFSNDVSKKVQAKDRARDALVGTLLFVAAVSGLLWGLARWVVTGS